MAFGSDIVTSPWTVLRSYLPFVMAKPQMVGDGTTDDYSALVAKLSEASGRWLVFPKGTYLIGTNISINQHVIFEDGAVLKPDTGVTITFGTSSCVLSTDEYKDTTLGSFTISGGIVLKLDVSNVITLSRDNMTVTGTCTDSVFLGGNTNDITTAVNAALIGGNTNSIGTGSDNSAILGGDTNTVSSDLAACLAGINNIASGSGSVCIGGGSNTASGASSVCLGGVGNEVSSKRSACVGGLNNTVAHDYSAVSGRTASTTFINSVTHGGADGLFFGSGESQTMMTVVSAITADATATEMRINLGDRLVMPNYSTWEFEVFISARGHDGANYLNAAYKFDGVITRDANAASTVLDASNKTVIFEDNAAWDSAVSADTTNGALKIDVTGAASEDVRWVARVQLTQVIYQV